MKELTLEQKQALQGIADAMDSMDKTLRKAFIDLNKIREETFPEIRIDNYYKTELYGGLIIRISAKISEWKYDYELIKGAHDNIGFCIKSDFHKSLIPLTPQEVKELEAELKKDEPVEFWANVYEDRDPFSIGLSHSTKEYAEGNINMFRKYLRTSKFVEVKNA